MPAPGAATLALTFTFSMTTMIVLCQNIELSYVIVEERPAMTHVGNVLEDSNIRDLVSSADISDLRYSFLTEGNPQASFLWINSTSGEIKTSSRINRESICQRLVLCELRVQTVVQAQLGAFFMIVQVKVTVTDVNDNAPTFMPTSITIKVSEGEVPGVSFRLPTATDPDMGNGNSVMEYNTETTSAPFMLVVDGSGSSAGISIRLQTELDREAKQMYKMFVQAIDGGTPRLTGTLTVNIEVVDVNDNSPVFDQNEYAVNISDSTAVDTVVARVKATDQDIGENGLVSYLLSPTQEDLVVSEMFYVNVSSGEVKNKVSLDSYAGRSYRLTIEAQDSATTHRTAKADVVIAIMDTHNSQPKILLNVLGVAGLAQVSELAELGRVVAHVAVSDPDSSLSPNGQVSCVMNNTEQFQLQAMDVKQFKIILTKRLDREQQTFHSLTVICEDSGTPPLNASSNFIVEVKDENDNPPVFDSLYYTAEVTEGRTGTSSRSGNDVILTVHASDRDTGENAHLTYRFTEGTDADFAIYPDGSIVVANPTGADREDKVKGAVRKLTVLATDGGKHQLTATATVVINIRDINDNPPKFSELMYFFSVPENSPTGHIVNNISATDADLESNGIFYFEIHKRDANMVPFQMSPSGVIKVADGIDRETKASYEFRVVAYDMGEPIRLSSTVAVRVKVVDVNDNSPHFVFPNDDNFTLYVPHTLSENTAFGSLLAIDRDEGRNSDLVFARDSGNGSKFFDVESETGHVILVRPLTAKEFGLHIIVVVAHDRGADVQMATQSVLHIVVYEGNATLPYREDSLGFRNIVVVVVLIVVTAVLAVAILLTILLIRRVDKQRRLYNAKIEEAKADSNLRRLNPCSVVDLDSPSALSDLAGDTKDGSKKKKEVSFSLDEDNNMNSPQTMTTFSTAASDKYDAISEKDRGKIKNDMLSSNHFQADRHTKSSSAKKEFNYHLVHPASVNSQKHKQSTDSARNQDDNSSDVSCDSTSDSGRGGSDVDLQSHGGVSKESGDTSFVSQRTIDAHNNLSAVSSGSNSSNSNSNINSNAKHPNKSVHFQNIRPDPVGFGSFVSPAKPGMHRSPRSPILPGVVANRHGSILPRYVPNVVSEHNEAFITLPSITNGRCSNPSYKELELQRGRALSENMSDSLNARHISTACGYTDMTGRRSCMSQKSNSNSCLDGAETWDGDTTTSGSYTVDPQELCDEIDKLFFDDVQDIVV